MMPSPNTGEGQTAMEHPHSHHHGDLVPAQESDKVVPVQVSTSEGSARSR